MEITTVLVLGGSGFVGRHVCRRLAAEGYRVRVPTRSSEASKALTTLPTVEVTTADIHDPAELERLARGVDCVVNLVGVLHDAPGNKGFRGAHVELARKVVSACRSAGAGRLLHMSALNAAPDGPSDYLRTKGEAEAIVRASGLAFSIFRPSVIFGPDDAFLNMFAGLARLFPVIPLGSPGARFQPVFVEDVARVLVASLTRADSIGAAYELCGPKVYTLRELVEYVCRVTRRPRVVIGLGDRLSYLQALSMEFSPVRMLTRDNYYSMKADSVCRCEFPLGMQPAALEAVAPEWLAGGARGHRPRTRRPGGR